MNKLAGLFGPERRERERERAGSLALGRDVRWHGGDSCVPRSGRGAD